MLNRWQPEWGKWEDCPGCVCSHALVREHVLRKCYKLLFMDGFYKWDDRDMYLFTYAYCVCPPLTFSIPVCYVLDVLLVLQRCRWSSTCSYSSLWCGCGLGSIWATGTCGCSSSTSSLTACWWAPLPISTYLYVFGIFSVYRSICARIKRCFKCNYEQHVLFRDIILGFCMISVCAITNILVVAL